MSKTRVHFKLLDAFYILMMVLPVIGGIVLQVLTKPASEGITITGARVFFEIPMPIQNFPISEAQVNSAIVMVVLFFFCLYMTHGLSQHIVLKRQHFAEWIVEKVDGLVLENMGEFFRGFSPFVISILALSALSSLLTLFGLFPPTSDVNIVAGWAILVFLLITHYKLKGGLLNYLKGFTEPIFLMTPMNILGEIATPVSLAFRHYGNVMSGTVIAVLVSAALGGLTNLVFGWLPGFLKDIPFFQVGLPAVLSVYFDIFSGCMQAYIFAMLTMLNISGGFPQDEYEKRLLKKRQRKQKQENN